MRVIWAPRAIARASEIAAWIATERPDAARAWVDEVFARAGRLARHPRQGRRVPDLDRADLREVPAGVNRILHRGDPERVVILTVRHGHRAWDTSVLNDTE